MRLMPFRLGASLEGHWLARMLTTPRASLFDLLVVAFLFTGGLVYHWNTAHWALNLVAGVVHGDAMFWWKGAVHVSEGMFVDHPGQGHRPGYFYLTGLTLPILGTDFL